jgi:hypothetical protein
LVEYDRWWGLVLILPAAGFLVRLVPLPGLRAPFVNLVDPGFRDGEMNFPGFGADFEFGGHVQFYTSVMSIIAIFSQREPTMGQTERTPSEAADRPNVT